MDSSPVPKPVPGTVFQTDAPEPSGDSLDAPQTLEPDSPVPSALLVKLLDMAPQPFAVVDLEGRFLRTNRAFLELTGYSSDELRAMSIVDLTPERWQAKMSEVLGRVHSIERSARYEKEYRRKDGRIVPVEVAVDLYHDERGEGAGFFAFVNDLSERKSVENALRESEDRYRRLYDEAPIGYHEVDTEGRFVSINRTECEMLGYPREEVLGRPVFDFLAAESREEALRSFPEVIEGKRPLTTLERTFVRPDGQRWTAVIEERYNRAQDGRVVGIRGTVLDITGRKRTEAALVASERRAWALFEGIEDAVLVHSPEGRILDANPAASRLLGYTHDELLALSTRDIDDPEFASGYDDRLRQQMTRGRLAFEGRHRTKDGRVIPVEMNSALIHFGEQRAVLAVIRDISVRKALEETRRQFSDALSRNARDMEAKNQALTESEARYRQLTEACLDGIVLTDARGCIILFNSAAEKIFGYRAEELLGQPLTQLIPPEHRAAHLEGFGRYVRTRIPRLVGRTTELRGLRRNGEEFPLELSLNAVELAGELQFIGSIRDQTERQRMRDMLAQTEKLASIGLLSAGVAHEINNPLAYVANNLAVLDRDVKGVLDLVALYESLHEAVAPSGAETLAKIRELAEEFDWAYVRENLGRMLTRTREGVQRVANIVQSLRSLARTSPPEMQPALVPDMIESAREVLRGRLKRHNIEMVVELGDVPPIVCVPSQISQVILNLLINAAQAIEARGRPEGGRIRVSTHREKDSVVLSVSDDGCGISPESMPKLFDPFFTTKPVGEGTGLGLSITHGIVTGHGGRIDVESRPDAGSCFRVTLPLKPS